MLNTVYRLTSPKVFEEVFVEVNDLENKVVVKPTYLSICKADQRYFQGKRADHILKEKLPMALIHEAVGEVIYDPTGTFETGDNVVMIPNTPLEEDDIIAENYLRSSKFKSSGVDGFLSDYVFIDPNRIVKLPDDIGLKVSSFMELMTVSYHAIERFKKYSHKRKGRIGVWGNGNVGYITSLLLKIMLPESEIIVFGTTDEKLSYFTFADEKYKVSDIPEDIAIDHGFECVGGNNSQEAINQIIDFINPQGTIALLGVSEQNVAINTRMVLEKGLILFGSSRSGREDFENTIEIIEENPKIMSYLENLITHSFTIKELKDLNAAFEQDNNTQFGKTVLKLEK